VVLADAALILLFMLFRELKARASLLWPSIINEEEMRRPKRLLLARRWSRAFLIFGVLIGFYAKFGDFGPGEFEHKSETQPSTTKTAIKDTRAVIA